MYLCKDCIKKWIGIDALNDIFRHSIPGSCDKCGNGEDEPIILLSVFNHSISDKSFFYSMANKQLEVTPDDFKQYNLYPDNPTHVDPKQKPINAEKE